MVCTMLCMWTLSSTTRKLTRSSAALTGPPSAAWLGDRLRGLLEGVLREALGGHDPLKLGSHQGAEVRRIAPPLAERLDEPRRHAGVEGVHRQDLVGQEAVAVAARVMKAG